MILVVLTLVAALFAAMPAAANPTNSQIQSKRQQAEVARAEIARLGEAFGPAVERYNRAVVELEQVEAEIAYNKQQIQCTKKNLKTTQATLGTKLEQSYRVGEPDLISSILGQQTLTEILAVADLFQRQQSQATELIGGLQADRKALNKQRRDLAEAEKRAEALRAEREAERRTIEQGIAQQQALAAGLEDEIAQLIAEEQIRQERIREQALAALAAQEEAGNRSGGGGSSVPAIGGSVGSSDGVDYSEVSVPPTDGSIGAQAVSIAMQYLGVPYVWGGGSPAGFDCSGLTKYVYAKLGISLTHYTGSQWNQGTRIPANQLLPGDLLFYRPDLGHMGMYIGNGQYIHAPQTGDVVKISPMNRSDYRGAVRPY
jgi:cell wall-associated NlpC family hydrolase